MIGLFSFVNAEEKNQKTVVKLFQTGVVKGSAFDYFKEDLKRYKIWVVSPITYSNWAGKLYLLKNYNNDLSKGIDDLVLKTQKQAALAGKYFCEGFFGGNVKEGYSLMDHFEVQYVENDNVVRLVFSGNVICMTKY